jgi:hypothetical protein
VSGRHDAEARAAAAPGYRTTAVGASAGRERSMIIGLAAIVTVAVAAYVGLRSTTGESAGTGTLLPYQMLVRDLAPSDVPVFETLRQSLLDAEALRSRTGSWPDATDVASLPASIPSASGSTAIAWTQTRQHLIVNYLGRPTGDTAAAAWLIRIQEPDPAVPQDTAPNDEEHHRLPDGTVLHVSIWTHRFGGQLTETFFAKPETAGWTQILTAPLNPIPVTKS